MKRNYDLEDVLRRFSYTIEDKAMAQERLANYLVDSRQPGAIEAYERSGRLYLAAMRLRRFNSAVHPR